MNLAGRERAELSDEFDRVGPDRPTLCAGWSARDLLAHLLVRERVPWGAPGILVPALAPVTERAPTRTGATSIVSEPILTSCSMTVWCFCFPS